MNFSAWGQHVAVKSNLLHDLSASMNLGLEFKLKPKTTLDFSVSYNPWNYTDNKKMKHILVQPELRFWTCESFFGHFFGLHAHYGYYNVGGIGPFTAIKNNRYEGWLAGAGLSYGYHWLLSNRWSLEATFGLGYVYTDYTKWECKQCGERIKDSNKQYFGPTKAGVSIIYILK